MGERNSPLQVGRVGALVVGTPKVFTVETLNISWFCKSIIMMRKALQSWMMVGFFAVCGHLWAQGTAYEAVKVLSEQRGTETAKRLLLVSGDAGTPQPLVWKVYVEDVAARGGFREFEISGGGILSERTPVRFPEEDRPTVLIQLERLNLDSDGAFTVANQQAMADKIGFDSLSYELRSADAQGTPVWTTTLLSLDGKSRGVVRIAADTGVVIGTGGMVAGGGSTFNSDASGTSTGNSSEDGGFLGRSQDTLERVGESTKRTTLRAAGAVQQWLTGKRTIDSEYYQPESPEGE